MMDIILTHGYFLGEDPKEQTIMRPYPPLGILYLSSYLRSLGLHPWLFDSTFSSRHSFFSLLREADCRILGIYTTHMTRKSVINQIQTAEKMGYTVIVGGPDSGGYPLEYLHHGADIVVVGEAEITLGELIPQLQSGRNTEGGLENINGLIYKDSRGQTVRTPARMLLDVDTIPWPDRENVDLEQYLQAWRSAHGETSLNIVTSRGCYYRCRWCSHAVFGNSERRRAPAACADEVKWLKERYSPDRLWYTDDVFTMDHDWIDQFADALRDRNAVLPFEAISRADRLQSRQVVTRLAEMGCRRLWIGSESGSNRILQAMGRKVTAEQIARSIQLCRQHGIETGMFLMWGYEGETLQDIAMTIEHVKRCRPDIFFTTVVHPIKNTPYYEDISAKLILPEEWATSSDKDIMVKDRPEAEFYRIVDQWLKADVKADKFRNLESLQAAFQSALADQARQKAEKLWYERT